MTLPDRNWCDWTETFGAVETGTWVDTIRHSKRQHEYIRALFAAMIEGAR